MLIDAYAAHMRLAGLRPNTVAARVSCLRAFERSLAAHHSRVSTCGRLEVEAYIGRSDLAPETRKAYRGHLRGLYAWAVDEGHLGVDPTVRLPAIRVPRAVPRPIHNTDLRKAVENADPRMRAWLLLMAMAGLRCIEVAGQRAAAVPARGQGWGNGHGPGARGDPARPGATSVQGRLVVGLLAALHLLDRQRLPALHRRQRNSASAAALGRDGVVPRLRPRPADDGAAAAARLGPHDAGLRRTLPRAPGRRGAAGPRTTGRSHRRRHPLDRLMKGSPMRLTLAALSLLAVTACGGGGGDSYDDTKALADALGCGGSHKLDDAGTLSLGAKETATCDAGEDRDYSLAVFGDDNARDTFVKAVSAVGGTFVVGDGWAVGAQTVDDAGEVVDKIGGAEV